MRKLATIRRIADIQPIEGADRIEVITIDGWKVVAQKGQGYEVGKLVVYFEIDSWIPHDLAPFLTKEGHFPKVFNEVKGERLKTIKLRGQVSQGLLMSTDVLSDVIENASEELKNEFLFETITEGMDVTELLGVQKWEAPLPGELAGQAEGAFPTNLMPKTDQERIQNMYRDIQARPEELYEETMKLDGSSMTLFRYEGVLRVCSRNWELKINEENANNTFIKLALQYGDRIPDGCAFQGEVMGPGVQGNREGFTTHRFFVFEAIDLATRTKLLPDARTRLVAAQGLEHAPIIGTYREFPFASLAEALEETSKMKSMVHPIAEGVVFKSVTDPNFSFKIISNRFLLKGGD